MKSTFWLRSCAAAGIAALVAGVTVVGSPSPHAAAATSDLDQSRIAAFTFEGDSGDALEGAIIHDDSDHGFDATIIGEGATFIDGQNGNALNLTGEQYLDLGTETALQPKDISVSFWFKPEGSMTDEQVFAWHKGQWDDPGWYLASQDEDSLIFSVTDDDQTTGEFYVTRDRDELFPADTWTHIAVTYNTELRMASFYQNGIKIDQTATGRSADSVGGIGSSDVVKGIGWNGPEYQETSLQGALDEFELFDATITPAQVRSLYTAAGGEQGISDILEADLAAVSLEKTLYEGTAPLPILGPNGSSIEWQSDSSLIEIGEDTITVTQPENGAEDAHITLRATATLDGQTQTKDYQATIPALATADVQELAANTELGDVTLDDPFLVDAQTSGLDYLMSLEPQKFLYNFYDVANVEQPAGNEPYYESWEDPEGWNFRGHMFGHYMSALAQQYAYTADPTEKSELGQRLDEVLTGLETAQDAWSDQYPDAAGYISAFPEAFLQRDGNGGLIDGLPANDSRAEGDVLIVPYYNLHKVLAGLVEIADTVPADEGGDRALDVGHQLGTYLADRLVDNVNKEQMLKTEYGGMNEALYNLYALTKDEAIKDAAELFDETSLFRDLADGKDVLDGKHANTTIPKLTGALTRYHVLTQDEELYNRLSSEEQAQLPMYKQAAQNFWEIVRDDHTYINGGNSQSEHFHAPGALWEDATSNDPYSGYGNNSTAESCNVHNMLKLSRELFRAELDVKYADYYEQAYTNQVMASVDTETGTTTYFQPMDSGYFKVFGSDESPEFWCCTGTGLESISQLGDSIYFLNDTESGTDVYVNMFYSSTLRVAGQDTTIKQESTIPDGETTTFTVSGEADNVTLQLREPDWAAGEVQVTVNDQNVDTDDSRGYIPVSVNSGDQVEYTIPVEVGVAATPDNSNYSAFTYGPLLLAAPLSSDVAMETYEAGVMVKMPNYDPNVTKAIFPTSQSASDWQEGITDHLTRLDNAGDGTLQFALQDVDDAAAGLVFQPWHSVKNTRYGIYFTISEPDSSESQQQILDDKERQRTEKYAHDFIDQFDNNNIEKSKNLQTGGESSIGVWKGRGYRDAENGGWFSYDLKYDDAKDAENYLSRTYFGGDAGREFEIYINDKLFSSETISDQHGDDFFDEVDLIDYDEFLKDNDKIDADGNPVVTVKFVADRYAGGIYSLAITGIDLNTAEYDSDPSLEDLTFSAGDLNPSFDGDVTEYELAVADKDLDELSFTAVPNVETALIKVLDEDDEEILIDETHPRAISSASKDSELTIRVYAEDWETSRDYTITFTDVTDDGSGDQDGDGDDGSDTDGSDESGNDGGAADGSGADGGATSEEGGGDESKNPPSDASDENGTSSKKPAKSLPVTGTSLALLWMGVALLALGGATMTIRHLKKKS